MNETEMLLKLYELTQEEERFYIEGYTKRVAFWVGFIGTILAGTTVGFFKANQYWTFFGLSIGPVLIFIVAWLAQRSVSRWYRRFIEVVTKVAKIEQKLGLTQPGFCKVNIKDGYWMDESLIPPTYIESRKEQKFSSSNFVLDKCKKGDYKNIRWFFRVIQILAIAYLTFLIVIGFLVMFDKITISSS